MSPALLALLLIAQPEKPFVIRVVDAETQRGVPLVELTTVNNVRFVTDSAGLVAFDEPGLRNQDVFFTVRAFGYELPKDGFGFRGKAFKAVPGGEAKLSLRRTNLAERIYRVTGEGIYRDTVLAGRRPPTRSPVLNGGVLGQDSVLAAIYGGKIHWFWGDTLRASYPLGNYHTPGATSLLPGRGGLDPDVGVDLQYDPDPSGFARPSAKLPGEGPTWLSGLTVLHDPNGRERMFATYDKIRNSLETYRRGMVEWDDSEREFRAIAEYPLDAPLYPTGHPFLHTVNGVEYVYFAAPLPLTRVKADPASFADLSQYEAFTPLISGARADANAVQRDASRRIVWGWKKGTAAARSSEIGGLIDRRAMTTEESILRIRNVDDTRAVTPHGGSVNWNPYRKRWVAIFVESGGSSYLGEVHFAEADTPIGPWVYARKIVSHAGEGRVYSFYNPKHHPVFDKDGGRTIFFEGTYTTSFSGSADPTPRYDYNQMMYKLDLGRPELSLPVPIYALSDAGPAGPIGPGGGLHPERHGRRVLFFAPDRPGLAKTVPVRAVPNAAGRRDLVFGGMQGDVLFYGVPATTTGMRATIPLMEFVHDDGVRHAYSTENDWTAPGYRPTGRIIGQVWRAPSEVVLPRD